MTNSLDQYTEPTRRMVQLSRYQPDRQHRQVNTAINDEHDRIGMISVLNKCAAKLVPLNDHQTYLSITYCEYESAGHDAQFLLRGSCYITGTSRIDAGADIYIRTCIKIRTFFLLHISRVQLATAAWWKQVQPSGLRKRVQPTGDLIDKGRRHCSNSDEPCCERKTSLHAGLCRELNSR